jgi:hypothetical protein
MKASDGEERKRGTRQRGRRKLSGLRAPKQFLLPMFGNSEGQLFIFPRKNENGESVAGSEKEILGACAANPDTLESHVSNSAIRRGKIRLSSLSVGDPPMHNTFAYSIPAHPNKTFPHHLLFRMPFSRHLSSFGLPSRGPHPHARLNFRVVSFWGFGSS